MDPRLPGVPSHEIFYYISAYWFSYKWFNPWKYHIHVLKIHSHFCINFLPKCEETKLKRAAPWNTILYSHNVHDFPLYVVLSIHTIGLYLCPHQACFLILSNQYSQYNSTKCNNFLFKFNWMWFSLEIQSNPTYSLEIRPNAIFSWNSTKSNIHLKFDQMRFSLGIQPNPTFTWNSTKCDFLLEFNQIQHSLEIRPNAIFSWNSTKSNIHLKFNQIAVLSIEIQPKANFSLGIWLNGITVEVMEFMWNQFLYPTNLLGSAVVKH
jgi:hypothetical protein